MSPSRDDQPSNDDELDGDPSDGDDRTTTPDGDAPTPEKSDPAVPDAETATGGPARNGNGDDAAGPESFGRASRTDPPPRRGEDDEDRGDLLTALYDVVSSAVAVVLVGALLFAVSGVWPPMVAIESDSMYPNMKTGDLVFVMDEQRFPGDSAQAGTGVVTAKTGDGGDYRKFAQSGDVIIYEPDGREAATPIIHRAMFWVNDSENWYGKADQGALGNADDCEELTNCPAPHAGFVTKGDANGRYDQAQGMSGPVKPEWVVGTAEVRIPKLGCIRLRTEGCLGGVGAANGTAAASG